MLTTISEFKDLSNLVRKQLDSACFCMLHLDYHNPVDMNVIIWHRNKELLTKFGRMHMRITNPAGFQ